MSSTNHHCWSGQEVLELSRVRGGATQLGWGGNGYSNRHNLHRLRLLTRGHTHARPNLQRLQNELISTDLLHESESLLWSHAEMTASQSTKILLYHCKFTSWIQILLKVKEQIYILTMSMSMLGKLFIHWLLTGWKAWEKGCTLAIHLLTFWFTFAWCQVVI